MDEFLMKNINLDYHKIFNLINEEVVVIDNNYNIVDVNDVFLKQMNYSKKDVIGKLCYKISHNRASPCEAPHDRCPLEIIMRTGKPAVVTHIHFTEDNQKKWIELIASPIKDKNGKVIMMVQLSRDITSRKEAEEDLRKKLDEISTINRIAYLANQSLDVKVLLKKALVELVKELKADVGNIFLVDTEKKDEIYSFVNYGFSKDFYSKPSLARMKIGEGIHGHAAKIKKPIFLEEIASSPYIKKINIKYIQKEGIKSGFVIPLESNKKLYGVLSIGSYKSGLFKKVDKGFLESISNYISLSLGNCMLYDEIRQKSDKLEILSVTDELTSLYNYRYLMGRLEFEFNRSKRYNNELSLLMMDLDNFKEVNDKYGHLTGDEVLRNVGKIIVEECRKVDIPARYGGDEFAVIFPNTSVSGVLIVAGRIEKNIKKRKIKIVKNHIKLSLSFGIASAGKAKNINQFMKMADDSLYCNKKIKAITISKNREVI